LDKGDNHFLIVGSKNDSLILFDDVKDMARRLADRAVFLRLEGGHGPDSEGHRAIKETTFECLDFLLR